MKKIGILNFQYSNYNYGAVLQAAALANTITELGYSTEHINYVPAPKRVSLKTKFLNNIKSFAKKVLGREVKKSIRDLCENSEEFELFREEWLPRTQYKYSSVEKMYQENWEYDAIVVGSDQVWRPSYITGSDDVFFLGFTESCRKIAYAASFGVDFWEETDNSSYTHKITKMVQNFDAVSVREKTGVEICKSVFEKDAIQVLDPTLLRGRNFFSEIAKDKSIQSGFAELVYYKLDVDSVFIEAVNKIAATKKYEIENIYYTQVDQRYEFIPVADWLAKIEESRLVITDSFHCTCFAILFEKEFIYYGNSGRGMTRLESLLEELDLSERICTSIEELVEISDKLTPIDYKLVNAKLDSLREASFDFLTNALGGSFNNGNAGKE